MGGYISGAVFYFENVSREKGIPRLAAHGPISADGKVLRVGNAASPCAADFNGDGLPDLLTAWGCPISHRPSDNPLGIAYFENVGSRTHPELKERPFPLTNAHHVGSLAVPGAGDLFGNGLLDLAISTASYVQLYRNTGSLTSPRWEAADRLKNLWGPVATGSVAVAPVDWNGDGNLDLVCNLGNRFGLKLNADPRNPPRWRDAGAVCAAGKPIKYFFPPGDAVTYPVVEDLNGDGLQDLLQGVADGHVWYYKNIDTRKNIQLGEGVRLRLKNGGLVKVGFYKEGDKAVDFASRSGDRSCPKTADFNGDGLSDLMVSDAYGFVTYFENLGTKNEPLFAEGVKVLHESGGRATIALTDWDNDGKVDILLAQDFKITIYRNVGNSARPHFQRDRELLNQFIPYPHPYMVDWNGDGDKDMLVSSSYQVVYLFERSFLKGGCAEARSDGVQRKQ